MIEIINVARSTLLVCPQLPPSLYEMRCKVVYREELSIIMYLPCPDRVINYFTTEDGGRKNESREAKPAARMTRSTILKDVPEGLRQMDSNCVFQQEHSGLGLQPLILSPSRQLTAFLPICRLLISKSFTLFRLSLGGNHHLAAETSFKELPIIRELNTIRLPAAIVVSIYQI